MTIPTTDLLRLTQWLSPTFPVSGYAYSHGLESAMADGRVTDAASTMAWVACVLRRGSGALDAWAIRAVMGGTAPQDVADMLRARAGCAERWAETRDMGAAFTRTIAEMGTSRPPDLPLPVALAVRASGMDPHVVTALYLQAFAGHLVGAATRFLPLGQGAAQHVLAALHPVIEAVAARTDPTPPGSAALLAELDAMAHETLQPRIFRT